MKLWSPELGMLTLVSEASSMYTTQPPLIRPPFSSLAMDFSGLNVTEQSPSALMDSIAASLKRS